MLEQLVTAEFRSRFQASRGTEIPAMDTCSVLVIEDFGTKGLLGDFEHPDVDGDDQNWNAFWHREGEGAKPRAANGGAGRGKATYFSNAGQHLVLAGAHSFMPTRRVLQAQPRRPRGDPAR